MKRKGETKKGKKEKRKEGKKQRKFFFTCCSAFSPEKELLSLTNIDKENPFVQKSKNSIECSITLKFKVESKKLSDTTKSNQFKWLL